MPLTGTEAQQIFIFLHNYHYIKYTLHMLVDFSRYHKIDDDDSKFLSNIVSILEKSSTIYELNEHLRTRYKIFFLQIIA